MNPSLATKETTFCSERRSLRKKAPVEISKSFFKKVYRPKTSSRTETAGAISMEHSTLGCYDETTSDSSSKAFAMAALVHFPAIAKSSRQHKAILNFRIKKLKRHLKSQDLSETVLLSGVSLNLRAKQPNSKSINAIPTPRSLHAQVRQRDSRGKFQCSASKCGSSELLEVTTLDSRDRSCATPKAAAPCKTFGVRMNMEQVLSSDARLSMEPAAYGSNERFLDNELDAEALTDDSFAARYQTCWRRQSQDLPWSSFAQEEPQAEGGSAYLNVRTASGTHLQEEAEEDAARREADLDDFLERVQAQQLAGEADDNDLW